MQGLIIFQVSVSSLHQSELRGVEIIIRVHLGTIVFAVPSRVPTGSHFTGENPLRFISDLSKYSLSSCYLEPYSTGHQRVTGTRSVVYLFYCLAVWLLNLKSVEQHLIVMGSYCLGYLALSSYLFILLFFSLSPDSVWMTFPLGFFARCIWGFLEVDDHACHQS